MKQKRTFNFIAEFIDGYAKGWNFAVRECFKDALDIKMTELIEPVVINGIKQYEIKIINGVKKSIQRKKKVLRWTQGDCYSFAEGHIFYDTPKGYLPWAEALQHINLICQVIDAKPRGVNIEGVFLDGYVIFTLSKPNETKDALERIGRYRLSQMEFVKFLINGDTGKLLRH